MLFVKPLSGPFGVTGLLEPTQLLTGEVGGKIQVTSFLPDRDREHNGKTLDSLSVHCRAKQGWAATHTHN